MFSLHANLATTKCMNNIGCDSTTTVEKSRMHTPSTLTMLRHLSLFFCALVTPPLSSLLLPSSSSSPPPCRRHAEPTTRFHNERDKNKIAQGAPMLPGVEGGRGAAEPDPPPEAGGCAGRERACWHPFAPRWVANYCRTPLNCMVLSTRGNTSSSC